MKALHRFWAFLSVGFVLIFMAKISKADLFYAYTQKLEPLEHRNSKPLFAQDGNQTPDVVVGIETREGSSPAPALMALLLWPLEETYLDWVVDRPPRPLLPGVFSGFWVQSTPSHGPPALG